MKYDNVAALLYDVAKLAVQYNLSLDSFSVFDDNGSVSIWVNCSDMFMWGMADFEQVTAANIEQLALALADAANVGGFNEVYGPELFCARIRKSRPQGAFYNNLDEGIAVLFDACGPKREPGLGNPVER